MHGNSLLHLGLFCVPPLCKHFALETNRLASHLCTLVDLAGLLLTLTLLMVEASTCNSEKVVSVNRRHMLGSTQWLHAAPFTMQLDTTLNMLVLRHGKPSCSKLAQRARPCL